MSLSSIYTIQMYIQMPVAKAYLYLLPLMARIILTTLVGNLIIGCASPSATKMPAYQAPASSAPAGEIFSTGSSGHVWSVDGAETPAFSGSIRIAPGDHRVGVNCLSTTITGVAAGPYPAPLMKSNAQFVVITGNFLAGQKYYVRCGSEDGWLRTWLSDSPNGSSLPPGFESLCTRECKP